MPNTTRTILRIYHRLIRFILVTAFGYLLLHAGKLVLFFSRKYRIQWRKLMVMTWARLVVKILGIEITVKGRPPESPFFLVSNHLSYIDIVVFFTQAHCVFVAKSEVKSWPMLGRLAKSAGTLFINRNHKRDIPRVNELIEEAIHESGGVIVFPEGTSSRGSEVLPFKSSLLEYAAEHEFPVSYASIHYCTVPFDSPAYLSVCWWGDMTFGRHFLDLLKLSRIHATVEFGPQAVRGRDRKIIAQELWYLINKQLAKSDFHKRISPNLQDSLCESPTSLANSWRTYVAKPTDSRQHTILATRR